ncbi:extensin-like [Vigna unguiculata]|uniref:Uncharacterized protein n=1 Tax=Vigna unguiculata TaxID=3917 RepID=A0A4D6L2S2_VIGUN|nr:extensin-like [Vigna unguiculata]QCD82812.1 hypothetical protein DEO72_LG2g3153 [Vigna unguiculata]
MAAATLAANLARVWSSAVTNTTTFAPPRRKQQPPRAFPQPPAHHLHAALSLESAPRHQATAATPSSSFAQQQPPRRNSPKIRPPSPRARTRNVHRSSARHCNSPKTAPSLQNHGSTTSHGRASSLHQHAPDWRRRTTASATLPANQNSTTSMAATPRWQPPFPQPLRTIAAAMAAIAPPPSSLTGEGGAAPSAAPLQHPQASMKP